MVNDILRKLRHFIDNKTLKAMCIIKEFFLKNQPSILSQLINSFLINVYVMSNCN